MDGAAQQKIIKLFKIQKKILIRGAHSAKTNEGNPRSIYPHLHYCNFHFHNFSTLNA